MKAIPVPVRERILHLYREGKSTRELARLFGYCEAAVRRVRLHFRQRGTVQPQTHRCGRKSLLAARREERLKALVAKRPDATLAELGANFQRPTSTMNLWLARLGLSYKKRCTPPSGRGPTWRSKEGGGRNGWPASPPSGSCSWMKAGPTRK